MELRAWQTADNVARWFLSRNKVKMLAGGADFVSNLRLQKLLYYAQGIHLALWDKPLFNDELVAWQYGPVVESVYQQYKENESDGIKEFAPPEENFSEQEEATLQFVQETFGQFSTWKLVDMACGETPYQDTPRNEIISTDKIKSYFEEHYVE